MTITRPLFLLLFSLISIISFAQNSDTSTEEVFTIVEEQPQYPGGMDAFHKAIANNLKYPKQARKQGIEGRVYLQFIVDKSGEVREIKTVKGIGGGCDEEAERVIKLTGKWKPGTQSGKPVNVRMVLPIIFQLQDDKKGKK
ncbi:MAG: energy transducer TonB [Cyclobacteriaceae bacterium]